MWCVIAPPLLRVWPSSPETRCANPHALSPGSPSAAQVCGRSTPSYSSPNLGNVDLLATNLAGDADWMCPELA